MLIRLLSLADNVYAGTMLYSSWSYTFSSSHRDFLFLVSKNAKFRPLFRQTDLASPYYLIGWLNLTHRGGGGSPREFWSVTGGMKEWGQMLNILFCERTTVPEVSLLTPGALLCRVSIDTRLRWSVSIVVLVYPHLPVSMFGFFVRLLCFFFKGYSVPFYPVVCNWCSNWLMS